MSHDDTTRHDPGTVGTGAAPVDALRALPVIEPPVALRRRLDDMVRDAATVTALPPRPRATAWFALAASAALAIWVALPLLAPAPERGAAPPGATPVAAADADAARLEALMARSAYLESVLASVPRRGRVQRVGTASTITALEDRVALIDARLSQPELAADAGGRAVLWRERVGLMNTLVSLHAAPADTVVL